MAHPIHFIYLKRPPRSGHLSAVRCDSLIGRLTASSKRRVSGNFDSVTNLTSGAAQQKVDCFLIFRPSACLRLLLLPLVMVVVCLTF
ncbi:hypothetical protein BU16DRAFT_524236 [Lophium mytilinum]|uniref:Uncharacterized protein n=1 Tax=Lophium mytilinum TaxID=390894 RepID=A0A6A6R5N6_9PEZI|nr:hypothetical protein BU16DRAFT_524236 [Lophium mytilinum]